MACISSNVALTTGTGFIHSGIYDITIAGGVEFMSDLPIRHSRAMRSLMLGRTNPETCSSGLDQTRILRLTCKLKITRPSGDRHAAALKISRKEQDEDVLRSYTLAAQAH